MKDLAENEKIKEREREILLYRMTIQGNNFTMMRLSDNLAELLILNSLCAEGEEDLKKLRNIRKYFKTLNLTNKDVLDCTE